MRLIRMFGAAALACAVWLSSGCGHAAVPVRAQTDAVVAVRAAREIGVENTPEASYHLALADDEMREAQELIRQGRMDAAERVLMRAKVDAELAMALHREAEVRAHAAAAHGVIEERQQQLEIEGR